MRHTCLQGPLSGGNSTESETTRLITSSPKLEIQGWEAKDATLGPFYRFTWSAGAHTGQGLGYCSRSPDASTVGDQTPPSSNSNGSEETERTETREKE